MAQDSGAIFRLTVAGFMLFLGIAMLALSDSSAQSVDTSENDPSLTGRWFGSADLNGKQIPFRLDL